LRNKDEPGKKNATPTGFRCSVSCPDPDSRARAWDAKGGLHEVARGIARKQQARPDDRIVQTSQPEYRVILW